MIAKELAKQIADILFVDGFGNQAKRLVLELDDKLNAPGWSKSAVIIRIENVLRESQKDYYWLP